MPADEARFRRYSVFCPVLAAPRAGFDNVGAVPAGEVTIRVPSIVRMLPNTFISFGLVEWIKFLVAAKTFHERSGGELVGWKQLRQKLPTRGRLCKLRDVLYFRSTGLILEDAWMRRARSESKSPSISSGSGFLDVFFLRESPDSAAADFRIEPGSILGF